MQIPFSDPSADGPVIESACREALARGFKVDDAFPLLERIRKETGIPVFLMSYGNILYSRDIPAFVKQAAASGVEGLIIPDLVYGRDEGLYEEGKKQGLPVIPVITPTVPEKRLKELIDLKAPWIYTALRSGITGTYTEIEEKSLDLLKKLIPAESRIMAGFGISEPDQVKLLQPYCDAVVAGSVFVRAVSKAYKEGKPVREAARETITYLLSAQ
jgi:tryptophan synthase alpha chain